MEEEKESSIVLCITLHLHPLKLNCEECLIRCVKGTFVLPLECICNSSITRKRCVKNWYPYTHEHDMAIFKYLINPCKVYIACKSKRVIPLFCRLIICDPAWQKELIAFPLFQLWEPITFFLDSLWKWYLQTT